MNWKLALLGMLVCAGSAAAQEPPNVVYRTNLGIAEKISHTPVVGAPYSATITNQNVQILADGNRIVQSTTGMTARDSQGRTRQDAPLPMIGNMAAANASHIVFINDPVAQKNYTLNLLEKTAETFNPGAVFTAAGSGNLPEAKVLALRAKQDAEKQAASQPALAVSEGTFVLDKVRAEKLASDAPVATEDLGTQTMEGVLVVGSRTTKTIPAGQIGNEKPINIVIEVWTSPELQTVVMSKRSDPRTGEQTFQLTNIVRAEPDPSLFTVPADFRVLDGPQTVIYKSRQ